MKYLLFILGMTLNILSFGQDRGDRGDKKAQMDALRIQFITEELDLTDTEAERFWPMYFMFEKEHKKLRKQIKLKRREFDGAELNEDELKSKLSELKALEYELADLKAKLILDSIPILGVEKSTKLITVEDKLRKKIGDRIKSQMRRE